MTELNDHIEIKKIEILYSHYNDTFQIILKSIKQRNIYTFIIFAISLLLTLTIVDPDQVRNITDSLAQEKVKNLVIQFKYIDVILLFGLLCISILFYRVNEYIDSLFTYIETVETKLSAKTESKLVSREGHLYEVSGSNLKLVTKIFFRYILPFLIALVSVIKAISEIPSDWRNIGPITILIILSAVLTVISMIIFIVDQK